MGRWLDAVRSQTRRLIWLDDTAYTARLFANGRAPWLDPGAWVGWRKRALQLLEPDIAVLDVTECATHWLERDAKLLALVRSTSEPGGPLRTLLSDDRLHSHLVHLLRALGATTDKPLALTIHSPRRWLVELYRRTFADQVEPNEDEIEDAAGDISRLLRALSDAGSDVLLLQEEHLPPARIGAWLDCYGSIVNVARHYRWDVGAYLPGGAPANIGELSFAIAPADGSVRTLGLAVDREFWEGAPAPGATVSDQFLYATIPVDAQPNSVLERLKELR
jgi:hypothetical protein